MSLVPNEIAIGSHMIGERYPCFVVAEAGVNHNGDLQMAKRLVDVAYNAGANAVKFQSFSAESLATMDAPKADYQKETTDNSESHFDMLKRLEMSPDMHSELYLYCQKLGILFLSSPFDEKNSDLLEELGVVAFKIPSGEITNLPFLEHVASKGKPMLVSTGMADISETALAVNSIYSAGNQDLILLHCVSNYPANADDINLHAMDTMSRAFRSPVGYSDHTLGLEVALASVALGANVLEKHFTLDKTLPGPDHRASLEPHELTSLIKGVRIIESALGDGRKLPSNSEAETAVVARKSLVANSLISAGVVITEDLVSSKRPGTGLPPFMKKYVIGRTARTIIPKDQLITLDDLS